MKYSVLFSLIFLVALSSCRKDNFEVINVEDEFTPTINEVDNAVNASLFGFVVDEFGNPMSDVDVYLNGLETTTNVRGHFIFNKVTMDGEGTFVQVRKEGYFEGSTRFFPKAESDNYTKVTLLRKIFDNSFLANEGATIVANNGLGLIFPANAIVDANGESYTGIVYVAAKWLDPTDQDLHQKMPGNLEGVNTNGNNQALESFGMMAVSLEGDSGESLNLGNNKKATLSFPVPASLLGNAPEEIPLWFFDESIGFWKQEGENAVLEGEKYVGEVSHFSFWNCDYPYPVIDLSGTIIDENGMPLANRLVEIELGSNGITGSGYTDNNGFFSGKVPADESLTLSVYYALGCDISFESNIGSFSADTDLGDIEIDEPNLITVTGEVVDCDGNPVTNGLVTVRLINFEFDYYLNGTNTFEIPIFNCTSSLGVIVEAIDYNTLAFNSGVYMPLSGNMIDMGVIAACGGTLEEYFKLTVDGETIIREGVEAYYLPNFDTLYVRGINSINTKFRDIDGMGNFDLTNIDNVNMGFEHSVHGFIGFGCNDGCSSGLIINDITISELGGSGEFVKGIYSGQMDITNGPSITVDFEAEFSILLD